MRFPEFEEEWIRTNLGDICKMQAGKFVAASEISEGYEEHLFPCYGGNGVRGYVSSFNHNGTYSLIGRQGALCGNVTLAQDKFYATEHAVVAKPNVDINTIWLYYLLTYLNLNQYATGMAQPGLSVQNLEKVETTISKSEKEQEKIGSFLSLVDERIQTQRKIIENLESLMRSLREQLFTQKLSFNKCEIKKWELQKLGSLGTFFSGGTPLTTVKSYYDGNIPFIKSGEIKETKTEQYISLEGLNNSSAKMVNIGDVIYALYGSTSGQVAISKIAGAINQAILCIRTPLNNVYLSNYLEWQKDSILNTYLQGGQGNLSAEIVKSLEIRIPSNIEQTFIASLLSIIDTKTEVEKGILKQYQKQRKFLLSNLFT